MRSKISKYSYLSLALIFIITLGTSLTQWLAPEKRLSLQSQQISHEGGSSYFYRVPSLSYPFTAKTDSNECHKCSLAVLMEEGEILKSKHSSHKEIRNLGGGRYSHWHNVLYFSSSDKTDPRTNGRQYELLLPIHIHWTFWLICFFLVLVILALNSRLLYEKLFYLRPHKNSSRVTKANRIALVLAPILVFAWMYPHEQTVRQNYANGGFITTVDLTYDLEQCLDQYRDLIIIGSSRAKEAIRPDIISELTGSTTFNCGAHGHATPDDVWSVLKNDIYAAVESINKSIMSNSQSTLETRKLLEEEGLALRRMINDDAHGSLLKNILEKFEDLIEAKTQLNFDNLAYPSSVGAGSVIVTVEPIHFSHWLLLARVSGVKTIPVGWFNKVESANGKLLSNTNTVVYDALKENIRSLEIEQRRPLHLWYQTIEDTFSENTKTSIMDRFEDAYGFNIAQKGTRFFSRVIYQENGFEGHTLILSHPDASRKEAFDAHVANYNSSLFDSVSFEKLSVFKEMLNTMQKMDMRVILVRLPVFDLLYEIEERNVADFNSLMENIAEDLDVRYVDLNLKMEAFTEDPLNFTDGSHLEMKSTELVTKRLVEELADSGFFQTEKNQ